jgi:hypothetical protein
MTIVRAERALEQRASPTNPGLAEVVQSEMRDRLLDRIAQRITRLAEAGKLERAGNLAKWRHSEVRLPPDAQ